MTMAKQIELFVREEGSQEIEGNAVAYEFRGASVDVLNRDEGEILVTFLWRTDFSGYGISVLQGILLNLLL